MSPRSSVFALILLAAGCANAPLTSSLSGMSPSPTPDVFACVRGQLKTLEFDQSSIDVKDYRVNARKFEENIRRPDVNFRRLVHRLEIEVTPGTGGAVTLLSVDAKTFAELTTSRGPTEEQERTSEIARQAAQTIIDECGAK